MPDLDRIGAACAVVVDPAAAGGFAHLATAWSVGPGEWLTAWSHGTPPHERLALLSTRSGELWDLRISERDGDILALRSADCGAQLAMAEEGTLRKRQPLEAVGYPSVIDHPAFNLHRGSLDGERYFPYLCPWRIAGHVALFTREEAWITGRAYPGMEGAPVLDGDGRVVGILMADGQAEALPPLTRFWRLV